MLAAAVDRSLREKANVRGLHPRQLHVFDDPRRDDRGWVLSVAHVEVVQPERLESRFPDRTRLMPIDKPGVCPTTTPTSSSSPSTTSDRATLDKPDPDGSARRRVHPAGVADRARGRRRRVPAARHLPSRDGTAPVATGATTTAARGRPAVLFQRGA